MRNNLYLAAGIVCLLTALIHTTGGQLSLVNPLLDSELSLQIKTEWLGAWHMITLLLWVFGFILFKNGLNSKVEDRSLIKMIGILNLLFALSFIAASIWNQQNAPQYIFFLPIALLIFLGYRSPLK